MDYDNLRQDQRYEYAIETVSDKMSGRADIDMLNSIIQTRAHAGWKLLTLFTNELGKNAISVGGIGLNATVEQCILIFEREIIKPKEENEFKVSTKILESNVTFPFVPKVAQFFEANGTQYVILHFFVTSNLTLGGVQGDLIVRNIFGDQVVLKNVCAVSFVKDKEGYCTSLPYPIELPNYIRFGISSAAMRVKHYINNGELVLLDNMEIESISEHLRDRGNGFNRIAFFSEIGEMKNAAEIYKYVQRILEEYPGVFTDESLSKLAKIVACERMYGVGKSDMIRSLNEYFDEVGF